VLPAAPLDLAPAFRVLQFLRARATALVSAHPSVPAAAAGLALQVAAFRATPLDRASPVVSRACRQRRAADWLSVQTDFAA
jgi:hypothetical protein